MDNNNFNNPQTTEPIVPPTPPKHASKNAFVIVLLAIITILSLGIAGYEWWQIQLLQDSNTTLLNDKHYLESKIDKLGKADTKDEITKDSDIACKDTPTSLLKDNIKAALDTKNTAAFATYTSNPVKFVIAASEKGDNETPDQAAKSLEYTHSATGPWDFNLSSTTLAGYDAGFYTDYFDANTYVGRAASGMVAAFDFNCDGKINQIFVAADEDLL